MRIAVTTVSGPATVVIDVTPPPVAVNDYYDVAHDSTLTVASGTMGVLGNDSDPSSGDYVPNITAYPSHGTLTPSMGLGFDPVTNQVDWIWDGGFTYTPDPTFTGTDSFTYTDNDGRPNGQSSPATVYLNVIDTAPTAVAHVYATPHDTPLAVAAAGLLAGATVFNNAPIVPVIDSQPSYGMLTPTMSTGIDPATNSVGTVWDGGFTYTPFSHFSGSDSFTYQVSDGALLSAPVTATINVTNAIPVAHDDPSPGMAPYTVEHDSSLTVAAPGVLSNDSDADGDTMVPAINTPPSNGTVTLNSDGSFTYTPNASFTGTDSFTYTVGDGVNTLSNGVWQNLRSPPATVTIHVTDTAPVALNGEYDAAHGQALDVTAATGVLGYASDPDGDSLTPIVVTQPTKGTLTESFHWVYDPTYGSIQVWDGGFLYEPTTDYAGTDSFTYLVSDGALTSSPATVTIRYADTAYRSYPNQAS